MSSYMKCYVPGCEDRKSSRHRFPHPIKDKERYGVWVKVICNPKLVHMDSMRVYQNCRVCHQHFTEKDKSSNMYLLRTTVPSQGLPSITEEIGPIPSQSCGIEQPVNAECTDLQETSVEVHRPITPITAQCRLSNTLLRQLNVTTSADLTPKKKHLYHKVNKLNRKIAAQKKRTVTLKKRLSLAKKQFHVSQNGLRKEAANFCMEQLMRKRTRPNGTRYSTEDKLMCLALYKTSGSAYRFLANWFRLPYERTLQRILNNIPLKPGLNQFLIQNLKKYVSSMQSKDRLCILMFDEMAILPHVKYNELEDRLDGMQNGEPVDHVLVCMIKGIRRNWKQPILYAFSTGPMKSLQLKTLLKTVIQELQEIDLEVIATICDQGAPNTSAIEGLVQEAREYYLRHHLEPKRRILINGQELIPIYDSPHLIKGIRNNLLQKNLIWESGNKTLVARWDDIVQAYEMDVGSGDIRFLPKITQYHVRRTKIKKMKVCYATQIFSHTMAAAITIMARNKDSSGNYEMPLRATGTAKILKFFNDLFDSLNSAKGNLNNGLKSPVTLKSGHISYWGKCVKSMERMYFQPENTIQRTIPPSLKNFILTLKGFIEIVNVLKSKNLTTVYTRQFNQDPLENFFGQIRQHRGRANLLNSRQFEDSFKTLLIRNVSSKHNIGANCEDTLDVTLFQLKNIISKANTQEHKDPIDILEEPHIHIALRDILNRNLTNRTQHRIFLFIKEQILPKVNCKFCKQHILKENYTDGNIIHQFKEYFVQCILNLYKIGYYLIHNYNFRSNIKLFIITYVKRYVIFSFICTHKETICDFIMTTIIKLCINEFCRKTNNVMNDEGK